MTTNPRHTDDLTTPAIVVDLDVMEANIKSMHARLAENGIDCRPHTKVHRIPEIARMQANAGSIGITCQTVGESVVMAAEGFNDIMITNCLIGEPNIAAMAELAKGINLSVIVESELALRQISSAATTAGSSVRVLVDCDLGMHRSGIPDTEGVLELARQIDSAPSVEFAGLAGYIGGYPSCDDVRRTGDFFRDVVQGFGEYGVAAPSIGMGGTTYAKVAWPGCAPFGVGESRIGNYPFLDAVKVAQGLASLSDCSLKIVSTVLSRPGPTRATLDVGWRVLSRGGPPLMTTFGHVVEYPEARIQSLHTEHAYVEFDSPSDAPSLGERVTVIPNSVDGVFAGAEDIYGIKGDQITTRWIVPRRSDSQPRN